jgi:hypothetical protein
LTSYDLSDMSQARIDMDGLNKSFDCPKKTAKTVAVPMIHKEYKLLFRKQRSNHKRPSR